MQTGEEFTWFGNGGAQEDECAGRGCSLGSGLPFPRDAHTTEVPNTLRIRRSRASEGTIGESFGILGQPDAGCQVGHHGVSR